MEIQLPLRYREVGQDEWLDSATRNISRTGALFQAHREYDAGVVLQIDLRLPAVPRMEAEGAQFMSFGRIVRSVAASGTGQYHVALAVQFLEYQFSRRTQDDS
jgi:hypothetical protein